MNKNSRVPLRGLLACLMMIVFIAWAPNAFAFSSLFDDNCMECHGSDVTCDGCHAHGVHSSSAKNDINLTAVTDKTTYAPGEMMAVTIDGGYRGGWVRAILYDQAGVEVVRSSGQEFPIILMAAAPTTPGIYTFSGAWYGNQFDNAEVGAGATFFGPNWTPDPTNPTHGEEIVPTNTFEVVGDGGVPTTGIQITGLTSDIMDSVMAGEAVTFTANAIAQPGVGPINYRFYTRLGYEQIQGDPAWGGNQWMIAQDWSTNNTATIIFPTPGLYFMAVHFSEDTTWSAAEGGPQTGMVVEVLPAQ